MRGESEREMRIRRTSWLAEVLVKSFAERKRFEWLISKHSICSSYAQAHEIAHPDICSV